MLHALTRGAWQRQVGLARRVPEPGEPIGGHRGFAAVQTIRLGMIISIWTKLEDFHLHRQACSVSGVSKVTRLKQPFDEVLGMIRHR